MKRSNIYVGGRLVAVLAVVAALSGCGRPRADYSLVELVNGHGTITLDGEPLAGAVVVFEDPRDDTMSYAMTDTDGHYRLQFDSDMSGVKVGNKVVRISTTRKLLGLNTPPGQDDGDGDPAESEHQSIELVPARYNKQSELNVEVTQAKTRYDFALDSK